jgi:hypothetical protein
MLVVISVGVRFQSAQKKYWTDLANDTLQQGIFQVEIKTGTVMYSLRGAEPFTVTFYKM